MLATYVREVKEDYHDILLSSQNFSGAAWWAKITRAHQTLEISASSVLVIDTLLNLTRNRTDLVMENARKLFLFALN